MPLIPTALPDVNRKSVIFNKFIFNDLVQFNRNITTIFGINELVDADGCLKKQFLKDDGLFIHLNNQGVSLLANCIKQSIFFRKQAYRSRKQVSNMSYASALRQPPHRS